MTLRVCFFHSDKPRERILADAWSKGVQAHGDTIELKALTPEIQIADADVACMVGVKSRELFRGHFDKGQHVVMIDKGYTRHAAPGPVKLWEYWRVSVDAHHPTLAVARWTRPMDRADKLGMVLSAWRKTGDHILFAGSSEKYHAFYRMRDPGRYLEKVVKITRAFSKRPIVYRPKPSWSEAVPVPGTIFSRDGSIEQALAGAWAMVTHGSNACFEAVLLGIPCVVLGDAVAKPISSTELSEIESPRLASYAERHQWLANLAYCQWTMPEMASGEAWATIRPQIYGE